MELTDVLAALEADPAGGFSVEIPEDWQQGRTVYGGLNAALAAYAGRAGQDDLGPLRALQIAFMAPSAGHVRYVPTVLRSGRSVTFVGVDCIAGEILCNRAILTYGQARDSDLQHTRISAPTVPAPGRCPEVPFNPGVTPVFLQHMELRFAAGSVPLSGGEPAFAMWVRHRGASGLNPDIALVGVADVLPPAVVASRTTFRPASSVTWTLDTAAVPADPTGWYLMTTSSDQAADGYSAQAMSCFGADGSLAAVSRQTVAAF